MEVEPKEPVPVTQAITPPVGKAEDDLYHAWKEAAPEVRPNLEARLLPQLRRHAAKVCWMVLHTRNPDLIGEIAQDAILELDRFQERSSFSTWFHSRALYRCRAELRRQMTRREVPLDTNYVSDWQRGQSSLETKAIVTELWNNLDDFERELVERKVFSGESDEEIAQEMGRSRSWVQAAWSNLRRRMKERYAS